MARPEDSLRPGREPVSDPAVLRGARGAEARDIRCVDPGRARHGPGAGGAGEPADGGVRLVGLLGLVHMGQMTSRNLGTGDNDLEAVAAISGRNVWAVGQYFVGANTNT